MLTASESLSSPPSYAGTPRQPPVSIITKDDLPQISSRGRVQQQAEYIDSTAIIIIIYISNPRLTADIQNKNLRHHAVSNIREIYNNL